jgi:hypothetical protein
LRRTLAADVAELRVALAQWAEIISPPLLWLLDRLNRMVSRGR